MENLIYLNENDIKKISKMSENLNPNVIFVNSESILFLNQMEKKFCLISNNIICIEILEYFIRNNDINKLLFCNNIRFSTFDYLKILLKDISEMDYKKIRID